MRWPPGLKAWWQLNFGPKGTFYDAWFEPLTKAHVVLIATNVLAIGIGWLLVAPLFEPVGLSGWQAKIAGQVLVLCVLSAAAGTLRLEQLRWQARRQ